MTLSDFYTRLGSSCAEVLKRIPSEQMLKKFVKMYQNDPSFSQLEEAIAQKDWQTAFRSAHTLKGVAQNLGFSDLQRTASELTESLRGAKPLTQPELLDAVRISQKQIADAMKELDA